MNVQAGSPLRDRSGRSERTRHGGVDAARVSLGVYGRAAHLDVESVSRTLGCEPTAYFAGGVVAAGLPAATGYWLLDAPEELCLEGQVRFLASRTTFDVDAWDTLSTECRVQLSCAVLVRWSLGFEFPRGAIAALASRPWRVALALFGPDGREVASTVVGPARGALPASHHETRSEGCMR